VNLILLNSVEANQKTYTGLTLPPQEKKTLRQTPFTLWAGFLYR